MLVITRTRDFVKEIISVFRCALRRNNNKEGFRHRIGGFHQDNFEIISQQQGKRSRNQKKTNMLMNVDDYQDTGFFKELIRVYRCALKKK